MSIILKLQVISVLRVMLRVTTHFWGRQIMNALIPNYEILSWPKQRQTENMKYFIGNSSKYAFCFSAVDIKLMFILGMIFI